MRIQTPKILVTIILAVVAVSITVGSNWQVQREFHAFIDVLTDITK